MDTAAQPQSDSPTYRDAAQRTRSFLNHPLRVGSAVGIFTAVGTLVALIKAQLLGTWWWLVALALLVLIIVAVAAADRSSPSAQRPPLLSEPSRENPQELSARSILGLVGFFVMLYGVGAVASALASSAAVYPITIGLTLLIAIIITWLGGFGMAPLAKPLPSDFTQHYPYPPTLRRLASSLFSKSPEVGATTSSSPIGSRTSRSFTTPNSPKPCALWPPMDTSKCVITARH